MPPMKTHADTEVVPPDDNQREADGDCWVPGKVTCPDSVRAADDNSPSASQASTVSLTDELADIATLSDENARLRQQVADLTGALHARDIELATLRERCQYLVRALEEQDETIAKIFAVVSPSTVETVFGASSATGAAELDLPPPPPPTSSHEQLLSRPTNYREGASSNNADRNILNVAIDRILHPPPRKLPSRRVSLFDDDPSTVTSPTSSCISSKSSSTRSFERRESGASEEEVARSAGFLRRPARRSASRLSITDYGLLEDDPDEHATCVTANNSDNQDHITSVEPASQRALFDEIDQVAQAKLHQSNAEDGSSLAAVDPDNQEDESSEMSYAEFLERLRLPASRDILDTIRAFLGSVLGPRGDGKPPRHSDYVDYDFYGRHELRRRCEYFFHGIDEMLQTHPLWIHSSEATLAKARDGIEKYVMDKLSEIVMNELDESHQWKMEDEKLARRMKCLSFVTADMLDIKPCMRNEVVWSMAEDELRRINSFRCPGDKINCIVRCCSIIFSVLNLSRGETGSRPGADDFLPVFIYIVLHSKIPRLYSNCEYISAYRNAADLMSKAGYCFVNLRSAVEFISVVDSSMLSVSAEEFDRLYAQAELGLGE